MKKVFGKIQQAIKFVIEHKIACTIAFAVVWIIFCDQNNLIARYTLHQNIQSLTEEKQYYINKIHNDSIMLNELKTNDKNLEKYAREQYFMKADDEDVFEIVEMP
jgi:cell division protein FtsB